MCDLKENLWLCLTCGNLGCGRAQFGGVGGNSHGLKHTELSNHPVAVKLGSITAEGNADVYCYACNEERIDPELNGHLSNWGINLAERQKTEKSLMEMQVEQNLKWDFAMTTEDGKEMQPVFGKGFTGLKNLGNSCYLASTLQCLFSIKDFQDRYFRPDEPLPSTQTPAEDLETQLRKIADGLLSERYSYPDTDVITSEQSPEVPHQKGLAPAMLKHLIGRGHEEFSTMRQQDAYELLLHLLKLITRSDHTGHVNPHGSLEFVTEQRLQCISCKKVRYRNEAQDVATIPVPVRRKPQLEKPSDDEHEQKEEFEPITFKECLDILTREDIVDYTCPSCNSKAGFKKRFLFKTFPSTLAVNIQRIEERVNWVPTKIDIPVIVDDEPFDLDDYISKGQQAGEESLPEDAEPSAAPAAFSPNQVALNDLLSMGFPQIRCEKALHATGNTDSATASEWLFSHMEDPDIDEPVTLSAPQPLASGVAVRPEDVDMMGALGIHAPLARKALKETGGDLARASDWAFSHLDDPGDFEDSEQPATAAAETSEPKRMAGSAELPARFKLQSIVCHKGSSIHAGHYVAFVRKRIEEMGEEKWVLFNDEKVVKAEGDVDEMKKFAYIYFFRRA